MALRRRTRMFLLAAIPALLVAGGLFVVRFVNYRAAKDYIDRLKRPAHGPWPRETVAQAVVVTIGFSAQQTPRPPKLTSPLLAVTSEKCSRGRNWDTSMAADASTENVRSSCTGRTRRRYLP